MASVLRNVGAAQLVSGEYHEAASTFRTVLDLARQTGRPGWLSCVVMASRSDPGWGILSWRVAKERAEGSGEPAFVFVAGPAALNGEDAVDVG